MTQNNAEKNLKPHIQENCFITRKIKPKARVSLTIHLSIRSFVDKLF